MMVPPEAVHDKLTAFGRQFVQRMAACAWPAAVGPAKFFLLFVRLIPLAAIFDWCILFMRVRDLRARVLFLLTFGGFMARKDGVSLDVDGTQMEAPGMPERDFKAELNSRLNSAVARVADAENELRMARKEERDIRASLGRLR